MPFLTSPHAIENYLKAKKTGLALYVHKENERTTAILKLAKIMKISIKKVDKAFLKNLGAFHCALEIREEDFSGGTDWFKEKLEALKKKTSARVVFLDSITDPHNLGAILRSAVLFNVDLVLYPKRRSAKGDSETVLRISTGAASMIDHGEVSNILQCCQLLKDAGFWIYGTDMQGKNLRHEVDFSQKSLIMIGSEGKGLSQSLRKACDMMVSIPTSKKIDSLNASVATAIVLYEAYCSSCVQK